MAVRANHLLDSVIKWLEEGVWHLDDSSRDDLLLITLKELLLLVSQDLDSFKVGLTGALSENALVLAARSVGKVSHGRVVL